VQFSAENKKGLPIDDELDSWTTLFQSGLSTRFSCGKSYGEEKKR
jgi:hypothetical protein